MLYKITLVISDQSSFLRHTMSLLLQQTLYTLHHRFCCRVSRPGRGCCAYFLREREDGLAVLALSEDGPRPDGVVEVTRPSLIGEGPLTGDLRREERRVGDSRYPSEYPSDSSSFLASCSISSGSSSGSRTTLDSELSRMLRRSRISSPARTLLEMYCCLLRISCVSWSLSVAT